MTKTTHLALAPAVEQHADEDDVQQAEQEHRQEHPYLEPGSRGRGALRGH